MYFLVLLFAAAALLGGGNGANVNRHMKILAELDNDILEHDGKHLIDIPKRVSGSKKFITIMEQPPAVLVHEVGTTLELTCDVLAAPAPSIRWFKNDAPVYEHELESTELLDSNPTSLARLSSTLLVPRSASRAHYSCLVSAGALTARASTLVLGSDGVNDLSERSKLVPLAPRVLVSYTVLVDLMGSNVVLPCRAKGHPRPRVLWLDNNNVPVKKDPRMKVLRSGELVVSGLRWSDMGEFSCVATNMFGTARTKTFVYPARPNGTDG